MVRLLKRLTNWGVLALCPERTLDQKGEGLVSSEQVVLSHQLCFRVIQSNGSVEQNM